MTEAATRLTTSFLRRNWDSAGGLAAAAAAFALATGDDVRDDAVPVLIAPAGAGLSVLSLGLAAMAIFATFFDALYRRVLEGAGGVRRDLMPYLIVATSGAAATVIRLLEVLAWPGVGWLLEAILAA